MTIGRIALKHILSPVIEALGFQVWGIEIDNNKKVTLLRVYIDLTDDFISVDDCALVSQHVAAILNVEQVFTGRYTLEVSSPGIERPLYDLEHYELFVGHDIAVKLKFAHGNRKNFKGCLHAVEGDEVVVRIDSSEYLFPFENIDRANIIAKF
ncbi:MAG: ribosome maturation factor RimP [Cellvibrionales bacterium TMED49]|nr:ribosome maturation factor RimP [Porticoccaceae bacterium]OUU37137.1 MAG: ribosome maturation factor RimP [Cellvibrionales bacterium TMED49]